MDIVHGCVGSMCVPSRFSHYYTDAKEDDPHGYLHSGDRFLGSRTTCLRLKPGTTTKMGGSKQGTLDTWILFVRSSTCLLQPVLTQTGTSREALANMDVLDAGGGKGGCVTVWTKAKRLRY